MQSEIKKAERYLYELLDLAEIDVKLVAVALSVMLEGLRDLTTGDFCAKCTYDLLNQMKGDLQEFAKSMKDKHEKEINIMFVFYDRIDILSKDIEKEKLNIKYCERRQAINN